MIQNTKGIEKYKKEYIGTIKYDAGQETISMTVSNFITVYHAEKNRLVIKNRGTGDILDKKETVTYQVTEEGLELIDKAGAIAQ